MKRLLLIEVDCGDKSCDDCQLVLEHGTYPCSCAAFSKGGLDRSAKCIEAEQKALEQPHTSQVNNA